MKHARDTTTFFKGLPVPAKIGRMTSTSISVTHHHAFFHWCGSTHQGKNRKVGTLLHTDQGPMARLPRVHTIQGACRIETARSRFYGILLGTGLWTRVRALKKETSREAEWRISASLR
jgi:hypothetical protein